MSAVVKVWIDDGCITCDACENICPEVFHVEDDTCIIVDGVNPHEWGDDIIEAAEACPVDVILYEVAGGDEPPAEEAPRPRPSLPPAEEVPAPEAPSNMLLVILLIGTAAIAIAIVVFTRMKK